MKKNFIHRKNKKQFLLIPLFLAVATASCPVVSFAEQTVAYSDVEKHWAANEIMKWSSYGVLQGFDGQFNPDASITRGEMAVVLNKVMNYQKTEKNTFEDVDDAFYKDPILKAYAAGVMSGADNKMRPKDNITHQEAIALLARAFEVEKSSTFVGNSEGIAEWAKGDVFGMSAVGGLDGIGFEAEKPITRAEVVKIIDNIVGNFYNTKGEYIANTEESVVINTPDVVLKNCAVKGDVIISEGVGDGDVTLENVQVAGRLLVHGGGTNTVKLNGCTLNTVSVDKQMGDVRVLSENNTKIANTIVNSGATLEGSFENVSVTGNSAINLKADIKSFSAQSNVPITMTSGKVNTVSLNAEGAQFKMDIYASVDTLNVTKKAEIETKGQINNVKIEKGAENTKLSGSGRISQVTSNANNVAVNTANTTVKLGEGVTNITQNGKEITTTTTTDSTTSKKSSSSSGGGGGGGGSSSTQTFTIDKLVSTGNNTVQVTLNKKMQTALDKSAVRVVRINDGKEMTVSTVTTQDNQVYTITTEKCENSSYRLELTIEGKKVQKEFTVVSMPFTIDKLTLTGNKAVQFTLNQMTQTALDKNAVRIVRISDGKEMTVSTMATQDNQSYTVTTEKCEDGNYRLELTVEAKKIQKEFTVVSVAFTIDKLTTMQNNTVQFTLNQKTETALDKNTVRVVRISDGKEMTVSTVATQDNQSYTVTTEKCEDGNYRLELTIEGKKIQKEFSIATQQTAFKIEKIESIENGLLKVTLNQKTEKVLSKNAFNIICTGGGKDMTILSTTTQDNQVYNLTTAYYNDNTYNLEITLADGTRIDKDFETKFDCAQIEISEIKRVEETKAQLIYTSDAPGSFYYLLQPKQAAKARSVSLNGEPTAQEVIDQGVKTEMKLHSNTITIENLTKDVGYDMYYVAVDVDNKITPVKSILIDSKVAEKPEEGDYSIASVKPFVEETNDDYVYVYGFEVVLNKATTQKLELSNFAASCPKGAMNLGEIKTTDNKTYKVYMPKGDIPFSNNHYTVTITFPDGKTAQNKFYLDLQAPSLSFRDFKWVEETTLIATINSDEAGFLYYSILDDSDDFYSTKPKDPTPIYENGIKIPIGYGETRVTLKNPIEGKWFCYASEDELGNHASYFGYKQIPAYVPPAPEEPDTLKISDVEVIAATGKPKLKVTFNKSINTTTIYGSSTQISGMSGKLLVEIKSVSGNLNDSEIYITILNFDEIPAGSHDLTLYTIDDEQMVYTFDVPESGEPASISEEIDTEQIPQTEIEKEIQDENQQNTQNIAETETQVNEEQVNEIKTNQSEEKAE